MNESTVQSHVVVVTGAGPLSPHAVAAVPASALVIAADGALDHALAAGFTPAGVVGDFDSISAEGMAWARAHATIQRHQTDKNHTDTELALAMAVGLTPARLTLIGAGDRLDHLLAAIGALGQPSLTSIPTIDAWWDAQHMYVVHGPGRASLDLPVGATISLLSLHGECTGVGISGVRWPLEGASLAPLIGQGVSNVSTEPTVAVRVSTGVLTAIIAGVLPETVALDDEEAA